jgi:hypothetical protein
MMLSDLSLPGTPVHITEISVADGFRMEDLECTLSFGKGTVFSAKLKFTDILQRW